MGERGLVKKMSELISLLDKIAQGHRNIQTPSVVLVLDWNKRKQKCRVVYLRDYDSCYQLGRKIFVNAGI